MARTGIGLLSESELAAWLKVSQRSIRRFVDAGDLTRVRVGHAPAYIWDDALKFVGVGKRDWAKAQVAPLMTTDEVSAICRGFPPGSIKRLARAGEIPSHSVGRALRFVPAEIAAWIGAKRTVPTANVPKSGDMTSAEQNAP